VHSCEILDLWVLSSFSNDNNRTVVVVAIHIAFNPQLSFWVYCSTVRYCTFLLITPYQGGCYLRS
jgi:hypothetical protein